MLGVSLRKRRRMEDIRMEAGIVSTIEKAREVCMRWYGHVTRIEEDDPLRMAWGGQVEGRTRRRESLR